MHIATAVAMLALVVGPAASDPVLPNLEGIALEDGSGLALLAAGALIDVDTAGCRPVDGLSADHPHNWWAFQQGRHVVVQVDCLDCAVRPEVFVFDLGGDAPARRIATERFVTPAAATTSTPPRTTPSCSTRPRCLSWRAGASRCSSTPSSATKYC